MQQPGTTDCHHTREPFDTQFRCIAQRRDISPFAKLVYGYLVSQRRMLAKGQQAALTQAEIGDEIGLSRHQVWRAVGELVFVGLVTVKRPGQGKPNVYTLHGIDEANLDGKASRTGRNPDARPPGPFQRTPLRKEERGRRMGIPTHGSAYLESRRGPIQRR